MTRAPLVVFHCFGTLVRWFGMVWACWLTVSLYEYRGEKVSGLGQVGAMRGHQNMNVGIDTNAFRKCWPRIARGQTMVMMMMPSRRNTQRTKLTSATIAVSALLFDAPTPPSRKLPPSAPILLVSMIILVPIPIPIHKVMHHQDLCKPCNQRFGPCVIPCDSCPRGETRGSQWFCIRLCNTASSSVHSEQPEHAYFPHTVSFPSLAFPCLANLS